MKVISLLLFSLQLIGCTSSQKTSCPRDCYEAPQAPLPSSILYETYRGSIIARQLPIEDRIIAAYNAQNILKKGILNRPYAWESISSSFRGSFELLASHEEKNTPCFKYKQTIGSDNNVLSAQGIACLDSYQVWRIVNEIPDINPWCTSNPLEGLKTSSELKTRLSRFVD
ncbi:MAG: hypothetical protein J0H12_04975 [Candidatus Paracaedimonas acanthamoebae]|uniref:Lipoprotein n=1 Tax=Candidatus Paracaedimonas acanthamoebae TaxID=244581 RepID=A0A8J7PT17_9PROT|nr:hypothetical protein [Candidatus Paracaedimonas acanthamoebae]